MAEIEETYSGPQMSDTFIGMFYTAYSFSCLSQWDDETFLECAARFYKIDTGLDLPKTDFLACHSNPAYIKYLESKVENINAIQKQYEDHVKSKVDNFNKNVEERAQMSEEEITKYAEELEKRYKEFVQSKAQSPEEQQLKDLTKKYDSVILGEPGNQ